MAAPPVRMAIGARGIIAESRDSFKKRMDQIAEDFRASGNRGQPLLASTMMAVIERTEGNVVDIKDAWSEAVRCSPKTSKRTRAMAATAPELLESAYVLTHCTPGASQQLDSHRAGVIRAAIEDGKQIKVYAMKRGPGCRA